MGQSSKLSRCSGKRMDVSGWDNEIAQFRKPVENTGFYFMIYML
jgi:hypothetical protein